MGGGPPSGLGEPEQVRCHTQCSTGKCSSVGVHPVKGHKGIYEPGSGLHMAPRWADQQDMAFGMLVQHSLDARSDAHQSVEGPARPAGDD